MLIAVILCLAAGLQVFRLSSPDVPLSGALLPLSRLAPLINHPAEYNSVWISAWVLDTHINSYPIISLRDKIHPQLLFYSLLVTKTGQLSLKTGFEAGESILFPYESNEVEGWIQVIFTVAQAAKLRVCERSIYINLKCTIISSTLIPTFHTILQSELAIGLKSYLSKSTTLPSLSSSPSVLTSDICLILSLDEEISIFDFESRPPALFPVLQDYYKLTISEQAERLLEMQWEFQVMDEFELAGWMRFSGKDQELFTARRSEGKFWAEVREGQLQVCMRSGDHIYCLDPRPSPLEWSYISVRYHSPAFEFCLGSLWGPPSTCSFSNIPPFLRPISISSVEVPSACLEVFNLRLYFKRGPSADDEIEAMETECVGKQCPLLGGEGRCGAGKAHEKRELGITHYSGITLRLYMPLHGLQYFTFVNNHANTVWIQFAGVNLGDYGDPDIYIYKPYTTGNADWQNVDWLTSIVTLYPGDSKLPAKGGIKGLYTMRVYGWDGPFTYEARVLVACASPSLALCNCGSGTYPNTSTSACSACPVGSNACQVMGYLGCLPYSSTTTAPVNTFNCQTCNNPGTTLNIYTAACVPCAAVCATCIDTGAAQCVTCKSGAALTGPIGSSTCLCVAGYFPNNTAANCALCSTTCATCVNSNPATCLSCKPNAELAGTSPNSCRCSSGYGGSASNCQPCNITCLTCSQTTASSCTVCKSVAALAGAAPNACVCPAGYFPDSDSSKCSLCAAQCTTCTGALDTQCTGCKTNAKRTSTTAPSSCVCVTGFYGDSAACQACDPTCGTCSSGGPGDCLGCKSNASLVGTTTPSTCACSAGFYPATTAANCQPCQATCATCSAGTSTSCLSCKANATLTAGVCSCQSGSFPNTTAAKCTLCNPSCSECSGSGTAQCKACFSNASLTGGANPSACGCNSGFVPTPGVNSCLPCDPSCKTCSTGTTTGCTSCYSHALLTGGPPGSCLCMSGLYPSPNAQTCLSCDWTCAQCTGSLATDCTACSSKATLTVVSGGKSCVCGSGTVPATCADCDGTCTACAGSGPAYCQSCKSANAELNPAAAVSYCECKAGFYPAPTSANCVACDQTCQHCVNSFAASCTSCYANAALQGGLMPSTCACVQGYFPNTTSKTCSACDLTCVTCTAGLATNCSACYPNASVTASGCVCDVGFFPNGTSKTCSACDDTCKTCAGAASTDCVLCYTNAGKTGAGACVCLTAFYPNPDSTNCSACDLTCMNCVGAGVTDCTQCYGIAVLENSVSPGKCVCPSSAFTLTNSSACTSCAATCLTCSNVGAACASCHPNAHLIGAPPSGCACDVTFLPINDVAHCVSCDKTCNTCTASGQSNCSSCFPNAVLQSGTSPSFCVCNSAFYPEPTTASCAACFVSCKECSGDGEFECSDCYTNAKLADTVPPSACVCLVGFYPDLTVKAKVCTACDISCRQCVGVLATDCTDCYSFALLSNSLSSPCICQLNYFPLGDSAHCIQCDPTCNNCGGNGPSGCTSCYPDASLVGGVSPSACLCDDGFYPDPTPKLCSACDVSCRKCVGPSDSQCINCYPPGALDAAISPGICICLDGYYPAPTAANCLLCAETCRKCVGNGSLDCYKCYENASVESGFPAYRCVCNVGYFPNPNSAKCAPCHQTCSECIGKESTDCTACKSFGRLNGSPFGFCDCLDGSYPFPDSSNCLPCYHSCLTCIAGDSSSCLTCVPGSIPDGQSPGACKCGLGFFPNPDAGDCQPCHPSCATCLEPIDCLSCKSNAVLTGFSCTCSEGFYPVPDAANCRSCSFGCTLCVEHFCQKCGIEYFSLRGECFLTCPDGYSPNIYSECEEIDKTPPSPTLTVTPSNSLLVTFSKPMNLYILASHDISIQVTDPNLQDVPVLWPDPLFDGDCTLSVPLSFETAYILPGTIANLTFLQPEIVVDRAGIEIEVWTLEGELNEVGIAPYNGTAAGTAVGVAMSTAATGAAVSSISMSILNGNPGILTSFVSNMQLMSYIAMTRIALPSDLSSSLAALNMGFAISNPFSSQVQRPDKTQTAPSHVYSYGIESTLFIANAFAILGTSVSLLLSYVPVYLLSKVSNVRVSAYFKALIPSIMWDTPMKLWLTAYLDLGVFSFIQLNNAGNSIDSPMAATNLVVAVIFGLAALATPFLIWSFLNRNYSLLASHQNPTFSRRWGSLTTEFRNTDAISLMYYLLFTSRRAVFFLSLTITQNYPGFITTVNSLMSMASLGYLVVYCPFALKLDHITAVANETMVLLVYLTVFAFVFELDSVSTGIVGAIGVWVTRATVFINVALSAYRTFVMVVEVLKMYAQMVRVQSQVMSGRENAMNGMRVKRTRM